jgi:hypothetical protein
MNEDGLKELRIEMKGKTKNQIHQMILDKQRDSYDELVKHNILINQSGDIYNISFSGPVMGISFVLNGSIEVSEGYITVKYEHNMESTFVDNAIERLAKKELEKRMN